jgi:Tryptophan synthase beta chain
MNSSTEPDPLGHWGQYGGRFVPETLMSPLADLTEAYEAAHNDEGFSREYESLIEEFSCRPTPLFFARRLTEHCGTFCA